MRFLLGFQYWTILPEGRVPEPETWMRLESDCSLRADWVSLQPLHWATLPLVACHCTMPLNLLETLLCWLFSISPYAKCILCPTLPWEADLGGLHCSLASLGLESERHGRGVEVGSRERLRYLLCCLSAPAQSLQGQCSSWPWLLSGSLPPQL